MKSFFLCLFMIVSNTIIYAGICIDKDIITPDETIVYKTIEDTSLSLHVFSPKNHQVTDQVPVIVFFFGGGWVGGTPKQFYEQSRYFSDNGIVAIAAEYRVNKIHGTTPFDAVTDAKSAIRWVRQHAKELGVDSKKIVASGGSAGGHVALCTDVIEGYEGVGEDVSISSKPNLMILYNPVLDTTEKGYGLAKVGKERKIDISPNHHIKKGLAPTIIFHGTSDKIVPYENADRFHKLMKKVGNECHLITYEGKGHGFFNSPFFRGEKADANIYSEIVEKSYLFLESRLMNDKKVKISNIFSDHMILQRGMPVPVWGTAMAREKITVSFAGQTINTIADISGKWCVQLDTLKMSKTARNLIVKGKNEIVITDVLVGEVWICSGQSNMAMQVKAVSKIDALVPSAENIRSFEVKRNVSLEEGDEVQGKWKKKIPTSAVAFGFAFYLEELGDVPVGIIHASWGSSSLEAWMPRDMTQQYDYFKNIMQDFDNDTITQNKLVDIIKKGDNRTKKEDVFLRRQPNILYNAMMKPLAPFAVRGLVWYQGERNTRYLTGVPEVTEGNWFHKVSGMKEYGEILCGWVDRYRKEWHKEDMHFMVVMLPGYGMGTVKSPVIDPLDPTAESWAWMRESQQKVLQLPHTSFINTIDLGDVKNIHPKDKLAIAKRLALHAAKETIDKDVVAIGPIMKHVKVKKEKIVVSFTNVEELKTIDGESPSGFWVSDNSMLWKHANAKIKRQKVILKSDEIKKPLYVRYAFSGKPHVNLVNESGLPAYPFRTDSAQK